MRTVILSVAAALALSACATVPKPLAGEYPAITPQQALTNNQSGQRVRWGGEIIKVEPHADSTCFEILARELFSDARPNMHDQSNGRFIACRQGFYDPAVYTKGRDITVVGTTSGSEQHAVGDYNYTYAKVNADEVYLWPKRSASAYPGSYGGWGYGPYGYDPFWYGNSGWYGGFYGGPVVIIRHGHH